MKDYKTTADQLKFFQPLNIDENYLPRPSFFDKRQNEKEAEKEVGMSIEIEEEKKEEEP